MRYVCVSVCAWCVQAEYMVCIIVSWKYLTEWTELMSNEPPVYHGHKSRIDLFGHAAARYDSCAVPFVFWATRSHATAACSASLA